MAGDDGAYASRQAVCRKTPSVSFAGSSLEEGAFWLGREKGVWEARNRRFRGRFATGLAESKIQATHREKGNLSKGCLLPPDIPTSGYATQYALNP